LTFVASIKNVAENYDPKKLAIPKEEKAEKEET